ncbi:MAG: hypothetical protein JWO83_864 [Caulobacteraceae bacterium]|jgi:hypothetical protein|nr:hypothetical protein [Caulobacteraceae bacterium]
MTGRDADPPRLLTRAFWAMMALAVLSFLAAAAVMVAFGSRHVAAGPGPAARSAPLAEGSRGAKTAPPQSSLGPP